MFANACFLLNGAMAHSRKVVNAGLGFKRANKANFWLEIRGGRPRMGGTRHTHLTVCVPVCAGTFPMRPAHVPPMYRLCAVCRYHF